MPSWMGWEFANMEADRADGVGSSALPASDVAAEALSKLLDRAAYSREVVPSAGDTRSILGLPIPSSPLERTQSTRISSLSLEIAW